MTVRRLERLVRRRRASRPDAGPLTVFLVVATADRPPGERAVWDGAAREVCYDPALGPPVLLPGSPHKLILGPVFDVWAEGRNVAAAAGPEDRGGRPGVAPAARVPAPARRRVRRARAAGPARGPVGAGPTA